MKQLLKACSPFMLVRYLRRLYYSYFDLHLRIKGERLSWSRSSAKVARNPHAVNLVRRDAQCEVVYIVIRRALLPVHLFIPGHNFNHALIPKPSDALIISDADYIVLRYQRSSSSILQIPTYSFHLAEESI